jgi:hypothetical protein
MPIDKSQQEELFAQLRANGVREDCPACGSLLRRVGDIVAPPATPDGGGTVLGGPSFPLVQLICEQCSYVMHFAATPLGIKS